MKPAIDLITRTVMLLMYLIERGKYGMVTLRISGNY